MKNMYLPEAKNDSLFSIIGNTDALIIMAYGIIFLVLIILIVIMIYKKRKGGKL